MPKFGSTIPLLALCSVVMLAACGGSTSQNGITLSDPPELVGVPETSQGGQYQVIGSLPDSTNRVSAIEERLSILGSVGEFGATEAVDIPTGQATYTGSIQLTQGGSPPADQVVFDDNNNIVLVTNSNEFFNIEGSMILEVNLAGDNTIAGKAGNFYNAQDGDVEGELLITSYSVLDDAPDPNNLLQAQGEILAAEMEGQLTDASEGESYQVDLLTQFRFTDEGTPAMGGVVAGTAENIVSGRSLVVAGTAVLIQ